MAYISILYIKTNKNYGKKCFANCPCSLSA